MARGIGNRQKKIVTPKKAWVQPKPTPKVHPLSPREKDGVRGKQPTTKNT